VYTTLEDFRAQYQLEPHQWVDVLALAGDASDNIRGVYKIGEKGALDLIRAYGSLEAAIEASSQAAAAAAAAAAADSSDEQDDAAADGGEQQAGKAGQQRRRRKSSKGKKAVGEGGGVSGPALGRLSSAEAQLSARLSRALVQIRDDLKLPQLQLELEALRLVAPADGGRAAVHYLGGQLGLESTARRLSGLYARMPAAAVGAAGAAADVAAKPPAVMVAGA
jgi:5'-3' exonuclease